MMSLVMCEYIVQKNIIVNNITKRRLRLKCLNWYGAHQETYVPGGLELRDVPDLVNSFKATGANCVRLTFSVHMVIYNPVVDQTFIHGVKPSSCENKISHALDIFGCVIRHLKNNDIHVILNNHNSWPTWVGPGQSISQGMWNDGVYTTNMWISSLETLAIKFDVLAFDLRNEIYDDNNKIITWGRSKDADVDWLEASSMASEKLLQINPKLLIIVGGLCYNLDIRQMIRHVGPKIAYDKGKLIYTTHIYSWSFWWNLDRLIFDRLFVFFVCGWILGGCAFYIMLYRSTKINYVLFDDHPNNVYYDYLLLILSASWIFYLLWTVIITVFVVVAQTHGCSTLALDAENYLAISVPYFLFSILLMNCVRYNRHLFITWTLFWCSVFFFMMMCIFLYLQSNISFTRFLEQWWKLDKAVVPIFVGEFGKSVLQENYIFDILFQFLIEMHELDFAYWAFNGRKFSNGIWYDESFGIMDNDYINFKDKNFTLFLFNRK